MNGMDESKPERPRNCSTCIWFTNEVIRLNSQNKFDGIYGMCMAVSSKTIWHRADETCEAWEAWEAGEGA